MQTCPGFFSKSLLEYPGNLLEICSVKSVDTLCYYCLYYLLFLFLLFYYYYLSKCRICVQSCWSAQPELRSWFLLHVNYMSLDVGNFGKCGLIFKFFSPVDARENYLCMHHRDFYLTCSVLLHCLVKVENPKKCD